MYVVDRTLIRAPLDRVFAIARDVERWPEILPHYRWVRMLERRADGGKVEMAAWRSFGPAPLRYPAWWVSEMHVEWLLQPSTGGGVAVEIVHRWSGPGWPLVGALAADLVIGPVFVHGIAS